jgi:hypothetical protein
VPALFNQHKEFSTFSSHADVGSFVHRVNIIKEPETKIIFEYFQFSTDAARRSIHALTLFHTFVMILDVFSDFLVVEQKAVPQQWQDELRALGKSIERQSAALAKTLPSEPEPEKPTT